ncbi:TPA: type 1 fimbrial protein [Klebsiella pneumoniae]|nr:type 1 fimbrial protein [Klebsiella pneumoniae]
MNLNNDLSGRFFSVLLMFVSCISTALAKHEPYMPNDNWHVDGLHGSLYISGKLIVSPCTLSAESEEQEINLGDFPLWQLAKPGDESPPTLIHFNLENCGAANDLLYSPEHGNNATFVPGQSTVLVRVIADKVHKNHHLIHLSGNAKGIALMLEDSNGHILTPGVRSWPQILDHQKNQLVFQVKLVRTGQLIEPGYFRTVVYLGLEYN